MDVEGKRVLVVGLARSGRAAADVLGAKGAQVTITDSKAPATFRQDLPWLLANRMGLELGRHRDETFLRSDVIVVSPGVPWHMPHLEIAREHNVLVVPEIEVAGWFLKGFRIGVTGTNGKTTTTTLLGKMMEASGFHTFVGGNIGTPLISAISDAQDDSIVITELSSFQLEGIRNFHVDVAVLLNVTPNHLDRHSSFEAYLAAKSEIFRNQTLADFAVLNADDPVVMSLASAIGSRKVFFSTCQNLRDGVLVADGKVIYRTCNLERQLFEARDVRLRGEFNLQNVLAATATACVAGVDFTVLPAVVRSFAGVEHRLEFVADLKGVEFFNDSKATSVDATAKALSAFRTGVHLIMGGKDKGAPYTALVPLMEGRVREVLLIGESADKIAQELTGHVELLRAGDLETAVRLAFGIAAPGETILLAPACASYDQFRDYEERGRIFKEIVERLAGEVAAASEREAVGKIDLRTDQGRPTEGTASASEATAAERAASLVGRGWVESSSSTSSDGTGGRGIEALETSEVDAKTLHPPEWQQAERESFAEPTLRGQDSMSRASPARLETAYVYEIGAQEVESLALDPSDDKSPEWSPTGATGEAHSSPSEGSHAPLLYEVAPATLEASSPAEQLQIKPAREGGIGEVNLKTSPSAAGHLDAELKTEKQERLPGI